MWSRAPDSTSAVSTPPCPVGLGQDQLPQQVEARDHTLAEHEDVALGQAELRVSAEEGAGGGVGRVARHDVPRQRATVAAAQRAELLGLLLEERAARHGSEREAALGALE